MRTDSAERVFHRSSRADGRAHVSGISHKRSARTRMPSTSGYMVAAGVAAAALFSVLWWMLLSGGDEAPWVLAGLAACVVMLVAVAAREVVMRRAWTRYILEHERHESLPSSSHVSASLHETRKSGTGGVRSMHTHSSAMRAIQKKSAEADAANGQPEPHLDVYHLCKDYLASTDETLRSSSVMTENRVALRAGQERVRTLQKHHLLMWARNASRVILHEAELRARVSDKIETAQRALDCIDSAMKLYPEETELNESVMAVREFIASVKVARWVEMAERAAFKGHYRRAVDRYRDALFYLSREEMREETRTEAAERINREIAMLRARLTMSRMEQQQQSDTEPSTAKRI